MLVKNVVIAVAVKHSCGNMWLNHMKHSDVLFVMWTRTRDLWTFTLSVFIVMFGQFFWIKCFKIFKVAVSYHGVRIVFNFTTKLVGYCFFLHSSSDQIDAADGSCRQNVLATIKGIFFVSPFPPSCYFSNTNFAGGV